MLKPKIEKKKVSEGRIIKVERMKNTFFSCFMSYGKPEESFAKTLYSDLTRNGVKCWIFETDYSPGALTWREITEKRRSADKFLVLCSKTSLSRYGLLRELQDQATENDDKIVPISLNDDWKKEDFKVKTNTMNLKSYLLDRNDIDFSDLRKYNEKLAKLLDYLRK